MLYFSVIVKNAVKTLPVSLIKMIYICIFTVLLTCLFLVICKQQVKAGGFILLLGGSRVQSIMEELW